MLIWFLFYILLGLNSFKSLVLKEKGMTAGTMRNGAYLRLSIPLYLFLSGGIILLLLIWTTDWDRWIESIHVPNGSGISYFSNSNSSPNILVNVEGGFIYDVQHQSADGNTGELTIKSTAPETVVSLSSWTGETIRVNLLNINPEYSDILLNGKSVQLHRSSGSDYWNRLEAEALGGREVYPETEVQKGSFVISEKGYWIDISLQPGIESFLKMSRSMDEDKLRFMVISDTHSGYKVFIPQLRSISADVPDFLIWNGDIVNNGYMIEYATNAAVMESLPMPVYPTIGNHDIWNNGEDFYYRYFGPTRYSFIYKDCLFLFINTSAGLVGSDQFDWIENELSLVDTKYKVVVGHIPPIDAVLGKFDDSELKYPEMRHNLFSKAESDLLIDILKRYSVDLFIGGHTHESGMFEIGGTMVVTSGALGGTVGPGDSVSYLEIQEVGNNLVPRAIEVMSTEYVDTSPLQNIRQALRVFLLSFIIDNSFAIALTLLWMLVISLWWIPVKRRQLFRIDS